MNSQNQYLKIMHDVALQHVIDNLVKEKENGGKIELHWTITQQNPMFRVNGKFNNSTWVIPKACMAA